MCRRCYESFSAVTEIDWESEQGGWSLCYHSVKGFPKSKHRLYPCTTLMIHWEAKGAKEEEQEEANYSLLCQVKNFIRFSCRLSTLPASQSASK